MFMLIVDIDDCANLKESARLHRTAQKPSSYHFLPANRFIVSLLRCHRRASLALSSFNMAIRPDFSVSSFSFFSGWSVFGWSMLVSPGLSFSSIMDEFLLRGGEWTENNQILYVMILFKVYVDMRRRGRKCRWVTHFSIIGSIASSLYSKYKNLY